MAAFKTTAPVPKNATTNNTGQSLPSAKSLPSGIIRSVFESDFADQIIASFKEPKENAETSPSKKSSSIPVTRPRSTSTNKSNVKGRKSTTTTTSKNLSKSGSGNKKPNNSNAIAGTSNQAGSSSSASSKPQTSANSIPIQLLSNQIQQKLAALEESVDIKNHQKLVNEGRLGPKIVKFDMSNHLGSFIISSDRLGLNSQSNFGSVRANVCVYKGKWQYEVQLSTCGIMQIGWATLNTKFTTEHGVGDSPDSYSFDGNRLRKWNFSSSTYGNEIWKGGDIIGCCIDLDNYKIEFFRNGVSLGVAFTDVHHGPGIAYFPAVSLTYAENIIANFGASPFLFAVQNYEPLQSSKIIEDTKSALLLTWVEKLLEIYPTQQGSTNTKSNSASSSSQDENHQSTILITNEIFQQLEENVHSAFVVEHTLLPFIAKQLGLPQNISHYDLNNHTSAPHNGKLNLLLDLMWTYFEENVMKSILERLAIIFMSYAKANTFSLAYPYQYYSTQLLIGLASHRRTRRFMIHHLLFDKTKITNFLYVRPVDEDVLKSVIPAPWWDSKTDENSIEAKAYRNGCNLLEQKINSLESIQVKLLKVLMTNTDGNDKRPSSRSLFLRMMRNYLHETLRPGSIIIHPISKPLCTFFRLLKTISVLWVEEIGRSGGGGGGGGGEITLPDLPPNIYYDTTLDYFDFERCGGSVNHLYKQFQRDVATAMGIPEYYDEAAANNRQQPRRFPFRMEEFIDSSFGTADEQQTSNGTTTMRHLDTPFPRLFPGLAGMLRARQENQQHTMSAPAIAVRDVPDHSNNTTTNTEPPQQRPPSRVNADARSRYTVPLRSQAPLQTNNIPRNQAATTTQPALPAPIVQHEMATATTELPTNSTAQRLVGLFPNEIIVTNLPTPAQSSSAGGNDDVLIQTSVNDDNGGVSDQDSFSIESDTSSTISFDEASNMGNNQQFPGGGGALIAETASGHNMIIPMFTEFRNFLNPDIALSLFPGPNFFAGFGGFGFHRQIIRPINPHANEIGRDKGQMDKATSLRELLDDALLLYTAGVGHHIEKVVGLRTQILEYITAVQEAKQKLTSPTSSKNLTEQQKHEINKSIEVYTNKLNEQSRHMAWLKCAVFTSQRQSLIVSFATNLLESLRKASELGQLLRFVPDSHFTALIKFTTLLLIQMHPTVSYQSIQGHRQLFQHIAEFVATHFNDPRIVLPETKDTLTQALSKFICDRSMLTALEDMPELSQNTMMKSLLKPYENRAWATSNWMLVRIWQGNGFGFQYMNCAAARKPYRNHKGQDEYGISTTLPPTPSAKLQAHITKILLDDAASASVFVHSVLNQLNWSFSEFIGQIQEINAVVQQTERYSIDSRQLKVCCTCFELTVALLRAVEMIASIARPVLTDFTRENTQSLLERLAMLLTQVLNRVGSAAGTFGQVLDVDITGLGSITYYAMLTSVAGILVALFHDELKITDKTKLPVTKTILLEPSLQLSSLDFLIGAANQNRPNSFSLRNYVPEDITASEITSLEATINHLKKWSTAFEGDAESISDDDICTICYAYPKTTTFKPCGHRACKTCIIHHLMNRGECFFCKGVIEKVIADDGTVIHDIHKPKEITTIQSNGTNTDGILTGLVVPINNHGNTGSNGRPNNSHGPDNDIP